MCTPLQAKKAAAMGNWWLAASSEQHACSCITSRSEVFFVKHQITQVTLRCGALQHLPFFKTKITFEREEISDHQWDPGKYNGAADGNSNKGFCRVFWTVEEMLGELCEVPLCLLCGGLMHHCPMYNVSCIFYNKHFFFHTWLDTFRTDFAYSGILPRKTCIKPLTPKTGGSQSCPKKIWGCLGMERWWRGQITFSWPKLIPWRKLSHWWKPEIPLLLHYPLPGHTHKEIQHLSHVKVTSLMGITKVPGERLYYRAKHIYTLCLKFQLLKISLNISFIKNIFLGPFCCAAIFNVFPLALLFTTSLGFPKSSKFLFFY